MDIYCISGQTNITIVADIEGSLYEPHFDSNYFISVIEIEMNGKNETNAIVCCINEPKFIMKNYKIFVFRAFWNMKLLIIMCIFTLGIYQ